VGPRVKLSEKVYAPVKEYPKVMNTHDGHYNMDFENGNII